ncbi:ATP-grasp domain-containing protein [Coprobacillus sp. AM37-9BH]|nr:ATP-grasp domain-containing protein [Coprobacillus sp. AM37-9BH]
MSNKYNDKKLLVLGGAFVHVKLIKSAQELGAYVIVTDNVPFENSPGKKIADEYWDLNIFDVDGIIEKSKLEGINGVISCWLDPCQRVYQKICEKLSLPCYGNEQQFFKMTDKQAFKEMCKENNVDVIIEYTEDDVKNHTIVFPVFVKPVDSRGSRGQKVCFTYDELEEGIVEAKKESSNGNVIIEKYIDSGHEFQVTYFYVDGEPYLVRTTDSYTGSESNHLEKVVACAVSPSKYTDIYLKTAHEKVINMFSKLGVKNGPIFMQGFYDEGIFRFFDPGLRFPGVDYELTYEQVFGISIPQLMVEFAFEGKISINELPRDGMNLRGNYSGILFPTLVAGKITNMDSVNDVRKHDSVISCWPRVDVGETIGWDYNVNQRFGEIDILAKDKYELCNEIQNVQNKLRILDENGNDMTFEVFDTKRIVEEINSNMDVRIITQDDLVNAGCMDISAVIDVCEQAFIEYAKNNVVIPDKISVIFNQETQDRINCLPAAILKERIYGMKWVSVFPNNPHLRNVPNLSAVILLSELKSGFPVAFMEGSLCSNLRTGAVGAVAAKYLSRENSEIIGFIGAGEQAKSHFLSIMNVKPNIKICKVSSRTHKSELKFIEQMKRFYPHVRYVACNSNYQEAVDNADIIVTAISGQEKILKDNWIKDGAFYCHVGGLEDDFGVPQKADKIIVDNWEMVKHRTQTISQMYQNGLLSDKDIYANLDEIIMHKKAGRENENEFIYFNSVGMSFVDVSLANWMYKKVVEKGNGITIKMKNKSMFEY